MQQTKFKGLVDLHVHAGPSISKRAVDTWEAYEHAAEAGFRGIVIKDHYFPSLMSADTVQKHIGIDSELKVYGELCLNNSVGGLNLKAVDAACGMGVKIVCMPTVSARHHLKQYEGKTFVGGGKESVPEEPIYYLDESGKLLPEAVRILDYLAGKPEVILATGHGSPAEIDVLVHEAVKRGIKRILVNHPFVLIEASMEQMIEWARIGAFIELNACDIDPVSSFADGDKAVVGEILKHIPAEQIVIDSDYGQNGNIEPVEGLIHFTEFLQDKFGVSDEDITKMGITNPGWLLGLNER